MRQRREYKRPPKRRNMGSRTQEKVHRDACGECYYCGRTTYSFSAWDYREMGDRRGMSRLPVVDHRIPLARGGADEMSNYVLSCWACNSSKGSKMPEEFTTSPPDDGSPWYICPIAEPRRDIRRAERFLQIIRSRKA